MKKFKKLFFMLFALAIIIPVSVFAAEQRYTTYIKMGHGTSLVGSYRNYEYKNHKIEFHPTKIEAGMHGPFSRLSITLRRKNFLGTTEVANKTADFSVYNLDTKTVEMGTSKADAKHRYEFFSGDEPRLSWGLTWADPVYTYSYN